MKTLKKIIVLIAIGSVLVITSCAKDGATGSVGAAGVDGINGTNGNVISVSDQTAYNAADGINGGKLYGTFWNSVTGFTTPVDASINMDTVMFYDHFFRCAKCHGYDELGSMGTFINEAPVAGVQPQVPAIDLNSFSAGHNITEIFNAVKHVGGRYKLSSTNVALNGSMPDYSKFLTDTQIWDIVKFLKTPEMLPSSKMWELSTSGVYPTGSLTVNFLGNATTGAATYIAKCASCHGADGTTITVDGNAYMGDFFRGEFWEAAYHSKFGAGNGAMPGFPTITYTEVADILAAGQDTLAFPPF